MKFLIFFTLLISFNGTFACDSNLDKNLSAVSNVLNFPSANKTKVSCQSQDGQLAIMVDRQFLRLGAKLTIGSEADFLAGKVPVSVKFSNISENFIASSDNIRTIYINFVGPNGFELSGERINTNGSHAGTDVFIIDMKGSYTFIEMFLRPDIVKKEATGSLICKEI